MKKIFGFLLVMMMLIIPFTVKAVTADDEEINIKDYKTLNLKETLAQESIKEAFKNYSENDKQVPIYLFRGNGCHYCQNFLNFLNSITEEYGEYFKLVSFEVWSDQNNSELLDKISSFMGENAGGVPYIIIGDQVFPGFADSYGDSIKNTIRALYDQKDRYDVFEAYNEAISEAKNEKFALTTRPIIFNFIFICIATVVICFFIKKQNENLLSELKNQKFTQKVVAENKETVKKPVTKKRK